jgi:hypothetical protein
MHIARIIADERRKKKRLTVRQGRRRILSVEDPMRTINADDYSLLSLLIDIEHFAQVEACSTHPSVKLALKERRRIARLVKDPFFKTVAEFLAGKKELLNTLSVAEKVEALALIETMRTQRKSAVPKKKRRGLRPQHG